MKICRKMSAIGYVNEGAKLLCAEDGCMDGYK